MTDINYSTLDTPAKRTLHWLNNSVLHNNGKIFVTFEHHETIRSALQLAAAMEKVPEDRFFGLGNEGIGGEAIPWKCVLHKRGNLMDYQVGTGPTPLAAIEAAIKALPPLDNTPINE